MVIYLPTVDWRVALHSFSGNYIAAVYWSQLQILRIKEYDGAGGWIQRDTLWQPYRSDQCSTHSNGDRVYVIWTTGGSPSHRIRLCYYDKGGLFSAIREPCNPTIDMFITPHTSGTISTGKLYAWWGSTKIQSPCVPAAHVVYYRSSEDEGVTWSDVTIMDDERRPLIGLNDSVYWQALWEEGTDGEVGIFYSIDDDNLYMDVIRYTGWAWVDT